MHIAGRPRHARVPNHVPAIVFACKMGSKGGGGYRVGGLGKGREEKKRKKKRKLWAWKHHLPSLPGLRKTHTHSHMHACIWSIHYVHAYIRTYELTYIQHVSRIPHGRLNHGQDRTMLSKQTKNIDRPIGSTALHASSACAVHTILSQLPGLWGLNRS